MLGGSYVGYTQWATIKEFPPHLKSILPIAAVGPGIDFPTQNNIGFPYTLQWLTYVSSKTRLRKIFGNSEYWNQIFENYYGNHLSFNSLPELSKNDNQTFNEWLRHPDFDDYWKSHHPTEDDYKNFNIPILTITGFYDTDYLGEMHYYKNHMQHGQRKGKDKHYLLIGPWSHSGTRIPTAELMGLNVGEESVINMLALYADWFNWTLNRGSKPDLIKDRVNFYSIGQNEWLQEKNYATVPNKKKNYICLPITIMQINYSRLAT